MSPQRVLSCGDRLLGTRSTSLTGAWCPVLWRVEELACAPKKNPVYAYGLASQGQLKDDDAKWISDAKAVSSDVATPAFSGDHFYVLDSDRKTLSCLKPDGTVRWTGELGSKSKLEASPTVADGKVYAVNFWADPEKFELLGVSSMGNGSKPSGNDQSVRAAVVAANGALFIRTQDKLWCVRKS
jgi:outer membrane protein assembly factor BamB